MNLLLAAVLMAATGSPTVSPAEFKQAELGMTAHHVESIFDTHGTLIVDWFGESGAEYKWKNYRASDGDFVHAKYRRPYKATHFRLRCLDKGPDAHTPCVSL